MKHKVTPGFLNVLCQPMKSRSRVYEMGTVLLSDVLLTPEREVIGEIIHQATEMDMPTDKIINQLVKVDPNNVPAGRYKAAYVVGDSVYVSKK